MIISPPFLPARGATQADEAWLEAAMPAPPSRLSSTKAPEGSFPLSHSLAWHNGIHIQAPQGADGSLPVRAIADGKVIFASTPKKANATLTDPQNYNPFDPQGVEPKAAWTDNGCVIIEHTTEIGAEGATPTEVVFYSLYMHLSELGKILPAGQTTRRALQAGDSIWRKDEVGKPGQIYGHTGQIHFEISWDTANLKKLIGRAPSWVEPVVAPAAPPAPTADGRIDSIYGSLYVYLPASTPTDAAATFPASQLRRAAGTTLGTAIWVKMTYAAGHCTFETFDERGLLLHALPSDVGAEYGLCREAARRHNSLPATEKALSSPSGWYELLRFGRNIGRGATASEKDLLPANAAHWRRIAGPGRQLVWADLNAAGSYKFSDADFLSVMGWNCINDDTSPEDQRCDSAHIKNLIRDPEAANTKRMEPEELARRLGNAEAQKKLKKAICKFPSEWDQATIASRYGFVEKTEAFMQAKKTGNDPWPKLEAHLKAISFDKLPQGYKDADWWMHPRDVVGYLRRCGWLSKHEFEKIYKDTSEAIRETYRVALNQVTRKYLYISNPLRLSHFMGQGAIESTSLRTMQEASMTGRLSGNDFYGSAINRASKVNESQLGHWYGAIPAEDDAWFKSNKHNSRGDLIASSYNWRNGNLGDPDALKFRGRGFKQLTGLINYSRYWIFRGWLDKNTFDDSWWTDRQYIAHNAALMTLRPPVVDDPQRATETPYNCLDTGGWYLGSERPDTLHQIDRDSKSLAVTVAEKEAEKNISYDVTRAINGGGIQRDDRLRETRTAKGVLL
jgi:predicted chitinase/murein DD-endopeptidase MepM/ murein hydrolase activator NlpD